jgi:glycosyltransferase involved in cell wall biosynthesis
MNCERSLTLVMDGNFRRLTNGIVSPHMGYARFGARYAGCFEDVVIVARSFPATSAVGENVEGHRVSFEDLGANRGISELIMSLPRLIVRLRRHIASASIVLIRFPGNIASLALLICLLSGKRFSVEVVADPADYFSAAASTHPLRRIARFTHRLTTCFAARHAVTVRYVTRVYLQRRYPGRDPRIMFGFSDVYLRDSLFELPRGPSDNTRRRFEIINVAMMHNRSKGHMVLLQAMAELRRRHVDVSVTFVGDGVLRGTFEAEVARLGLDDSVCFTGLIDADCVVDMVAKYDLFVLPSYQEGMPRAMLEAMAVGTPVVASNVGGIREVLGETSMVPPGDVGALAARIELLVRDGAQLNVLAAANRKAALPFGCSALEARYRDYCLALINAHRDA